MHYALAFLLLKFLGLLFFWPHPTSQSGVICSNTWLGCCAVQFMTAQIHFMVWVKVLLKVRIVLPVARPQVVFGSYFFSTEMPLVKYEMWILYFMPWSSNKGDCFGKRVPAWCAGAHHPAVTASRRAPPHHGLEPSPPAEATPQVHSQENSPP